MPSRDLQPLKFEEESPQEEFVDPLEDGDVISYEGNPDEETQEEALDALEVSAEAEDSEQVNRSNKASINQSLDSIRQQVSEQTASVLAEELVSSPGMGEQKVAQAQALKAFAKKERSAFFTDPTLGEYDAQLREDRKQLDYNPEEIDVRKGPVRLPDGTQKMMTKGDEAEWRQGFQDRFYTELFWFPSLIQRYILQDEEEKESHEAFAAYQQRRSQQSQFYAKGNGAAGYTFGAVLDPFTGSILKIPAGITAALRGTRAIGKLSSKIGLGNTLKFLKSSSADLASHLKTDDVMLKMILEETAGRTDEVSKKFFGAATNAVEVPAATKVVFRPNKSVMRSVAETAAVGGDEAAQDAVKSGISVANNSAAKGLEETQDKLIKAIDAEEALPLTMIPDLPNVGVKHPLTNYGVSLNNATGLSNIASDKLFYDVMSEAQKAVEAVHTVRIAPVLQDSTQRAVDFGLMGKIFEPVSKIRALVPGGYKFKNNAYEALVEGVTRNRRNRNIVKKAFSKQLDIIYRGLNKEEKGLLDKIIRATDDAEDFGEVTARGFKVGPTLFKDVSPKLIDRIRARQFTMRWSQKFLNTSAVSQAKSKGFRALGDNLAIPLKYTSEEKLADIIGDVPIVNRAGEEVSDVLDKKLFQIIDPQTTDTLKYVAVNSADELDELTDSFRLIGDRAGYLRMEYTDKYRVFKVVGDQNGNVMVSKPVATGDNWREVQEYIAKETENAASKQVSFVGIRATGEATDLAYNKNWMDFIERVSDEEFEQIIVALQKNGNLDPTIVEDLVKFRDKFGYKRASQLMQRSKKGLQHVSGGRAPHLVGKEADAAYLDWLAKYTNEADYVTKLETKFMEEYGTRLNLADPYGEISIKTSLGREARAYQKQLLTIRNRIKNHKLEALDNIAQRFGDVFIRSKNPVISRFSEYMDNLMPLPSGFLRGSGKAVTVMALGSFNAIQLPLQFSAAFLNSVGTTAGRLAFHRNRKATMKALVETQVDFAQWMTSWLQPDMVKTSKTKLGKYIRSNWDFIERTGVSAGLDYDDINQILFNVRNMRGITGSLMKGANTLADKSAMFYRSGEKLGQVYSAFMARRIIENEIKAGVHATLKASDLANGGSQKFINEVTRRAKTLALNMMKHNSAGITQGELSSLIFKFKDFGIHQAALFVPGGKKNLKAGELIGLYATWVGLFGPKGIPFAWDAVIGAEEMAYADNPEGGAGKFTIKAAEDLAEKAAKELQTAGMDVDAKTVRLWIEDGVFAAASDGKVRMATRFAVGEFLSDYITSANMDEAALGAVYTKFKRLLFDDVPDTLSAFIASVQNDEKLSVGEAGNALKPLAKQFTGLNNFIKAHELVKEPGVIRDKKGRILLEGPTLSERLMTVLGQTPGRIIEQYELQGVIMRQKKSIRDYMWTEAEKISKLPEDLADLKLDMLISELNDLGMLKLSASMMRKVYGEKQWQDKNLSLEERNQLRAYEHAKATGEFNETFDRLFEGD